MSLTTQQIGLALIGQSHASDDKRRAKKDMAGAIGWQDMERQYQCE